MRMATEQQVAAQRELHETRLQGRSMPAQNGHRSFNPDDAEGVHSIIEGLEQAGIGAAADWLICMMGQQGLHGWVGPRTQVEQLPHSRQGIFQSECCCCST